MNAVAEQLRPQPRDPAPFRPVELTELIAALQRIADEKLAQEKRAVGAGRMAGSFASLLQWRRRSVIHYLQQLQALTASERA